MEDSLSESILSTCGMDFRVIQGWLGLPPGDWPPEPHLLLGLKPGETDVQRIEQRVHERLAKVRCYQLSHPEQATEAMNRLAQAFLQLTETAKPVSPPVRVKGPHLEILPTAVPARGILEPAKVLGGAKGQTTVDWRSTPPPVRATEPRQETPPSPDTNGAATPPAPVPVPATVAPPAPTQDPLEQIASRSREAQRGLGTLLALMDRIESTRKLLWAWEQAGKYMSDCRRTLSRQAEEAELTRRLDEVAERLEDFPPLLGQPGQPGYRVIALARLQMTAPMFKTFDEDQRQALARDWEAGRSLLRHHHRFLLQELKKTRQLNRLRLGLRIMWRFLRDYPLYCLYGLLGLAFVGVLLLYLHIFLKG